MTSPPKSSSLVGQGTPKAYRMPAEWEPHQGTWVAWPHNPETWPGKLDHVRRFYVRLIQTLATQEEVHVLVNDRPARDEALRLLGLDAPIRRIQFHLIPTNDAWVRDYGPTVVRATHPGFGLPPRLAVRWDFNAWGGKYPPWDQDQAAGATMARTLELPAISGSMILEGGAIETNGAGLLLTTTDCLLNPNRNPLLTRETIEAKLHKLLGIDQVIWLTASLMGDDTDGHIDQLVRFVSPTRLLVVSPGNRQHPNDASLAALGKQVEQAAHHHGLEVQSLPPPPPISAGQQPLPASYANFYVANQLVLVPQFGVPTDAEACRILADCFPQRRVIGFDCSAVVEGLGAIHCLTLPIPRG
ncbi:MAG: agmatine deiminase family protein [Planctomycetota bacterium]